MPRVIRNYQREDFTDLLGQLHSIVEEPQKPDEKPVEPGNEIVNLALRKRTSKMDNHQMRYAFSSDRMLLHDRECELVKEIPDEKFDMLEYIDESMNLCKHCYRRAIIRNGIDDDGKRIRSYVR